MRLARFNLFVEAVDKDERLRERATALEVYRFWDDQWFDKNQEHVPVGSLTVDLNFVLGRDKSWKRRSSRHASFPISQLDAVVRAEFSKAPHRLTRDRFFRHLMDCLDRASDSYAARYDTLTGLMKAEAFEEALQLAIRTNVNDLADESSSLLGTVGTKSVSVLALDIDFFKQINDLYGHSYGDAVLTCFAMRLERASNKRQSDFGDQCEVSIARPHGEEFFVLIQGPLSDEQVKAMAEAIRLDIGGFELPNEDEWQIISREPAYADLALPPSIERKMTVSIGSITLHSGQNEDPSAVSSKLVKQADIALFRAKTGGRNTCRHFADILNHHGRVLEHHSDTDIVVIDIGKLVNVKEGHEFLVFHPDFTGEVNFTYKDGRTERRLGRYPRVPFGRIIAFNVQDDVSFCRVANRQKTTYFSPGCGLELVPVGSITHLLSDSLTDIAIGPSDLVPAIRLPQIVKEICEHNRRPFACVVELRNVDALLDSRGTAFVNSCLAETYRLVLELFPASIRVGQLTENQLAVIGEISGNLQEDDLSVLMKNIITKMSDRSNGLALIACGAFKADADTSNEVSEPGKPYSAEHALDFARFAVSIANPREDPVRFFDDHTAARVLINSRTANRHADGIRDYHYFRELGIKESGLENQAALIAFEQDVFDLDLALAAIETAIDLESDRAIYYANKAIICVAMHNWEAAYVAFSEATEKGFSFSASARYLPAYAMSAFRCYESGVQEIQKEVVEELLESAQGLSDIPKLGITDEQIADALGQVKGPINGVPE